MPAEAWEGDADRHRSAVVAGPLVLPDGRGALEGPVLVEVAWRRSGGIRRPGGLGLGDAYARLVVSDAPDAELTAALARDGIACAGADTLGAVLDGDPALRLALPFVLGARSSLGPLVDPLVLGASSFDFDAARSVASVFVPTSAYGRALSVLAAHRFVVFTGPPEMGKTAAARMVALARLTEGWQVHECQAPAEAFAAWDPARAQVFVADDAFGSTEYRPDAAERWARDLPELLSRLDDGHWLIWTSRPAPLRAALRRLQRERGAERFPQPAEVLVDASELSPAEKALILFRHARGAEVPGRFKRPELVAHPHFTPERIRRVVALGVPALGVLVEPTDAMRASFEALGEEHRARLVAMLDVPPGPVAERDLVVAMRRHARSGGTPRPPHELVDRLTDHFLRVSADRVSWVHPSWRDLVIEQLASDDAARIAFLGACDVDGALLALSSGGGSEGERSLPLLLGDADFDALGDRLVRLVRSAEDGAVARLLAGLGAAVAGTRGTVRACVEGAGPLSLDREVSALADAVLSALRRRWDQAVRVDLLEGWFRVAEELREHVEPPAAAVGHTWFALLPAPPVALDDGVALARLDDWLALVEVLYAYAPDRLAELGHEEQFGWLRSFALAAGASPHVDLVRRILARLTRLGIAVHDADVAMVSLGVPAFEPYVAPGPELPREDVVWRVLDDL